MRPESMTDEEFIAGVERCTLPPDTFHHADHVHLAWLYLRRMPPLDALARFTSVLQRFAASHGKADRYHETITWAYLLLIHERIRRDPAQSWDHFVAANRDLLRWNPSILDDYYRPETLLSPLARTIFVFPDAN